MKRKVATIINNMCQLVNDPSYVLPFIDRLVPGLERAEEEMTDENAKRVLKQTRELLLQNVVAAESFQPMEPAQIEETLMATIKHDMSMYDSPQLADMVKYCAQETWLLVDRKDFEDASWSTVLLNHIDSVTRGPVSPEYATKVIAKLNTSCFMRTVLMSTKRAPLPVLVSLDTAHFYRNWPLFSCASVLAADTGQYWFS